MIDNLTPPTNYDLMWYNHYKRFRNHVYRGYSIALSDLPISLTVNLNVYNVNNENTNETVTDAY